jgi:uncharacterized protein (TIGR02246 family)
MTKLIALLGASAIMMSTSACEKYDTKSGGADAASVTAAIQADEKAWNDQFKAKDQNALTARYADDAYFVAPGAPPASGSTAIAKVYAEALSDPAFSVSFASDKIAVSSAGDMAVSRGHFSEKHTDPKTSKLMTSSGGYVTVYKKQADGSWKVTDDITSASETKEVPPAKPATHAKMVSFG